MGEYAEMMLDGTCCATCGEYMGGGDGFATYCSPECAGDQRSDYYGQNDEPIIIKPKPCKCDICGKTCKSPEGVKMHKMHKHPPVKVKCNVCGEWKVGKQGVKNHQASGACERVLANKAGRPKRHVAPTYDDDFDVIDDGE